MVLTPNERKQAVPSMVFSYFDPLKDNYVTLRSNAIPVRMEGGALAAATPPGSTTAATASSGTPAPAAAGPPPKPQDILYQLTERGRVQSFTPIYAQPVFWTAQIFPLAALLGFVGLKIRQSKIDNREAQRVAALQHEAAELMRKLRRNDVSPEEYFSQASRAVRVKTALRPAAAGSIQMLSMPKPLPLLSSWMRKKRLNCAAYLSGPTSCAIAAHITVRTRFRQKVGAKSWS